MEKPGTPGETQGGRQPLRLTRVEMWKFPTDGKSVRYAAFERENEVKRGAVCCIPAVG